MIYKFQPFSTSKQLGKEYNAHISLVPNYDDWCLIMDYDAMILTPKTYQVIEKAIERYPDTAIFGSMTNRIAYPYQRLEHMPDENDSIRHHIAIAEERADKYADGESVECFSVAGFFMLFKKEYWHGNHFQEGIFDSKGTLFDRKFCQKARDRKQHLRIIKGAYLWHSYRLNSVEFSNTDHLK